MSILQPYTPFQGINVGLYHIFLYDWINAYTREGVLVLRLEDWHADQVSVYRTILEFLELSKLSTFGCGEGKSNKVVD